MVVNDVVATGAQPIAFLDYIACGRLDVPLVTSIVRGISEGCKSANVALLGELYVRFRQTQMNLSSVFMKVVKPLKCQLFSLMVPTIWRAIMWVFLNTVRSWAEIYWWVTL